MFNYNFRSQIKLYQNFGRLGGGSADVPDIVALAEHIDGYLAGWAQMQISLQLKAYNNDAIATGNQKDCVTARFNFYNSADPTEKMTLVIPCFKTVSDDGTKSAEILKAELGAWLAQSGDLRNQNGIVMDRYKASGLSAVRDVFVSDTASTSRT